MFRVHLPLHGGLFHADVLLWSLFGGGSIRVCASWSCDAARSLDQVKLTARSAVTSSPQCSVISLHALLSSCYCSIHLMQCSSQISHHFYSNIIFKSFFHLLHVFKLFPMITFCSYVLIHDFTRCSILLSYKISVVLLLFDYTVYSNSLNCLD